MSRKLAAILSADVAGFSRLMAQDEEATLKTLMSYRGMFAQLVEGHQGHIVASVGDNVLAEFASAVNAVECAVAIQKKLQGENQKIDPKQRMEFRIGVNLGDVLAEDDSIYGNGVNVAARIEGLADPGGVSVSASIYEQVKNKLSVEFIDLGRHQVKNIAEPVRVFGVLFQDAEGQPARTWPAGRGERPVGKATRILLVDDHDIVRNGIKSLVEEEEDMEVVAEASDGRQAVLLAKRHQPDVVIMDLSMPNLNGVEATRQIAEMGGDTRVLVLSMHRDPKFVAGVLEAGASGYLIKSCTAPEMFKVIRLISQGGTYLSPEVTELVVKGFIGRLEDGSPRPPASQLSPREREILQLLVEGQNPRAIAQRLNIEVKTVEAHRRNLMEKLKIDNLVDLVRYALREGVCSMEDWLSP